ncbi:hypothetical protein M0D69_35580 [Caballeronia sp. SEWSISQ10-4 2]|jgi:hypothetical protein|uniref:hypothetical protein n=1 Tax=Caballeronia sp. SEWSISQ10-4 2 TaxID=2937438 RepID=UPI0026522984|nr:hypothetical protein [Caballeronia sp. SEWSISQ10-4 2]MDN7183245.1 hypothetical protein [Caballeronia sp. SEWSISQ10-4 2]
MNADLMRMVAHRITRYLRENPTAADTVEGVHIVWVGHDLAHPSLDITQAALELLFDEGLVACVPIGNRLLWRAVRTAAD